LGKKEKRVQGGSGIGKFLSILGRGRPLTTREGGRERKRICARRRVKKKTPRGGRNCAALPGKAKEGGEGAAKGRCAAEKGKFEKRRGKGVLDEGKPVTQAKGFAGPTKSKRRGGGSSKKAFYYRATHEICMNYSRICGGVKGLSTG